jgi:HSP20 family protein
MRNLIRWNPRSDDMTVTDPFRAVDQMMNDLWADWPFRFQSDTMRPMLRPAMDVVENEADLTVRIDLPGLTSDDVNVEIEDHTLTIRGEIGDTVEQEGDRYHYRERSYGAFQRSIRLPNTLDTEKVDATFENGVLSINIPKLPQAKPKQITVKASKK